MHIDASCSIVMPEISDGTGKTVVVVLVKHFIQNFVNSFFVFSSLSVPSLFLSPLVFPSGKNENKGEKGKRRKGGGRGGRESGRKKN